VCGVLLHSSSDLMKKLSVIGQQKPADDAVQQPDSDEQSAKRMKVTDELRYI